MFKQGLIFGAGLGVLAAFIKDENGNALKDAVYGLAIDESKLGKDLISQLKQLSQQTQAFKEQAALAQSKLQAAQQAIKQWTKNTQPSLEKLKKASQSLNKR